jgi:hypothetical protein
VSVRFYDLTVTHKALIAALAAVGGLATAVTIAARSSPDGRAGSAPIRRGCPSVGPGNARAVAVDQVIATARRVVIDHRTEKVQVDRYRLNEKTTPVLEAVMLGELPRLPGTSTLRRLAKRRCGATDPTYTWAVVFGDTISVVCCLRTTLFVAPTKQGWFVF